MHRSFGIETHPSAKATWKEIVKGPTLRQVRDHLKKVVNYRELLL